MASSHTQINYIAYHNYNKILKSDWLSTALISASLIGRYTSWLFFFTASKNLGICFVLILKRALYIYHKFCLSYD